jgi:hypothetical protein
MGAFASRIRSKTDWRAIAGAAFILHTAVCSTFGGLIGISPPPSVMLGALQSQTNAYIFKESTETLSAPLAVDIDVAGTYNNSNPNAPGVIPAGTTVTSYFITHESVNNAFSTVLGFAISPDKILGIITTDAGLDATDSVLGHSGTLYPTGLAFRGLEMPYSITPDAVTLGPSYLTISFTSNTAAVLDQIRVITVAQIPEPTSLCLAGLGGLLALLAGRKAWRRRG